MKVTPFAGAPGPLLLVLPAGLRSLFLAVAALGVAVQCWGVAPPSWVNSPSYQWKTVLGGGMWHQSHDTVQNCVNSGYIQAFPRKFLMGLRSAVREDGYRFDLDSFDPLTPNYNDFTDGKLSNEGMAKMLEQTNNVEFMWSIPVPTDWDHQLHGEHTALGFPWQKAAYYAAYVQYMLQPADMTPTQYNALQSNYSFWTDDSCTTASSTNDTTLNHNWGNLRAKRGHPDPYPIRFIILGIEPYGDAQETLSAADYGSIAEDFRSAIRARGGVCATIPLGLSLNYFAPTEIDSSNHYFSPMAANCTMSDFSYIDLYHHYMFGSASDTGNVFAMDYPNAVATDTDHTWFYPDLASTRPSDVPYNRWLWQYADTAKALSTYDSSPGRWKIGCAEHGLVIASPYGDGDDLKGGMHWALWLSQLMDFNPDWDLMWTFLEQGMAHSQIVVRNGYVTRTPAYFVYKMAMEMQGYQVCSNTYSSPSSNSGTYDSTKPYTSDNVVVKVLYNPADSHYHLFIINKSGSSTTLTGWESWHVSKWDQIHSSSLTDMNQLGDMKPSTSFPSTTTGFETITTQSVTPPTQGNSFTIAAYSINHIDLSQPTSGTTGSPSPQSLAVSGSTSSTVTYQMVFSESVTGVDATDFTVTASGVSASVSSVSGSGSTYSVVVGYSGSSGTIRLDLKSSGTSIVDADSNAVTSGYTGATFNVVPSDTTAPVATALTHETGAPTSSINYYLTFSEAVTGVGSGDFTLNTTGDFSASISSVSGSGANYTIAVSFSGSDGSLRLDLNSSGTGIADLSSNSISGGIVGDLYSIHPAPGTPPQVLSIELESSTDTTVTYRIVFDSAVTGVDTSDFMLTAVIGTTASVTSVDAESSDIYRVTVTDTSMYGGGRIQFFLKGNGTGILNSYGTELVAGINAAPYKFDSRNEQVWFNDTLPPGAGGLGAYNDAWTWVSSSPTPMSGFGAHQSYGGANEHRHWFGWSNQNLALSTGETIFVYVYLDPTDTPSEIMLEFSNNSSWDHRAYWGSNTYNNGINGTVSRQPMGSLPATGQWVRLEIPASAVGLEGDVITGIDFISVGGKATWDKVGKMPASAWTVEDWFDDALPTNAGGLGTYGGDSWSWVSSPTPASGALAHESDLQFGEHRHWFGYSDADMTLLTGDVMYTWIYIDPAHPPSEIMLVFSTNTDWEHRIFWGNDLYNTGTYGSTSRMPAGAIPEKGQWVKLEIPASWVGLEGETVTGVQFVLIDGKATWDALGRKY